MRVLTSEEVDDAVSLDDLTDAEPTGDGATPPRLDVDEHRTACDGHAVSITPAYSSEQEPHQRACCTTLASTATGSAAQPSRPVP